MFLTSNIYSSSLTLPVVAGRFCGPMPSLAGNTSCCLPCPQTNWVYGDSKYSFGTCPDLD